jgi:hypothetical protein
MYQVSYIFLDVLYSSTKNIFLQKYMDDDKHSTEIENRDLKYKLKDILEDIIYKMLRSKIKN